MNLEIKCHKSHDRGKFKVLDLLPSTLVWGWVAKLPSTVCQKVLKITLTIICVRSI